ncbi:MAG: LysR family transcriptional regulator [Anaerolineales bacterium]|nr:LysR family transcriptional regulator [Anaerolineales bacterium]MCB9146246.1 LysR family transcriptional regulator [Anaerolineales bacterium]
MIEISSLRVFLAAAEEKNFSLAAKRLHMSQSAVSQHIHAMEQAYNVELFIRRGRSIDLSEAGEALLPMAREVIRSARLMEDSLQNIHNQIGGELLLGCSTSAGKYLMPVLLSLFQEKYPAVHPRVKVMSRDSVLERLLAQKIPLGVTSKLFEHREIECQPLFEDRIYLIVPTTHPWAEYGKATPDDLIGQHIIMREEMSGTCETVMQELKTFSITPDMLNVVMELGSANAIEMAVERGVGIAFVSEMIAARGLAFGRVKKVEMQGMDLRRTVYIARHINHPFTRAQNLFWEFVQEQREHLNTEIWNSLTQFEPVA